MKSRVLAFSVVALACVAIALVAVERIPYGIPYESLQANSVRVDVGYGCGTGVLVTRKVYNVTRTYVWTAGHVVAGLRKTDGTFATATIYQERRENNKRAGEVRTKAKVIAYSAPDSGEDLAILEILQDNFPAKGATFCLDTAPISVGTELVHVGCTLGLYNSVSLGIMSQTDRNLLGTGYTFDQTSVMGYPGSSGGGVYLKDGRCIGLLTRGAGAGLNFIVPVRRMLPWAKKMGVAWAIDPSISVPMVRAETPLDLDNPEPTLAGKAAKNVTSAVRPKADPYRSL